VCVTFVYHRKNTKIVKITGERSAKLNAFYIVAANNLLNKKLQDNTEKIRLTQIILLNYLFVCLFRYFWDYSLRGLCDEH